MELLLQNCKRELVELASKETVNEQIKHLEVCFIIFAMFSNDVRKMNEINVFIIENMEFSRVFQ